MGFRSRHQSALNIPYKHRPSTKPGRTRRRQRALPCPSLLRTEVLGDRVRTALGAKADDLEKCRTPGPDALRWPPSSGEETAPPPRWHANALIRLVLRPLARTMTDPEANRIRDDVYLALHEGPVKELIGG